MPYLLSFSRYQTKCVIKFLFDEIIKALRFIFNCPLKQWPTKKKGKAEIQTFEYLENEKSFLGEMKSIFLNYLNVTLAKKITFKNADFFYFIEKIYIHFSRYFYS